MMNLCESLKGIDFIFVMDGAWEHGGRSATSTDGTMDEVRRAAKEIKDRWKIEVIVDDKPNIWASQAAKRNYCLQKAEEIMKQFGYINNWFHLILDGDETIHFGNGWSLLNLQADGSGIPQLWPKVGLVKAFGQGSGEFMWAPRLVPAFQGFHWFTGDRYTIHDKKCKVVADFWRQEFDGAEKLEQFFIINNYFGRPAERTKTKYAYLKKVPKSHSKVCLLKTL